MHVNDHYHAETHDRAEALDLDEFTQRVEDARWRISWLRQRAGRLSARQVLPEALQEASSFLEQMRRAHEELRQQNEELTKTRHELLVQRQRYSSLFEFDPDAYLITTANGVIEEANQASREVFQISDRGLIGRNVLDFVSKNDAAALRASLAQPRSASQAETLSITILVGNGKPLPAAVKLFSLPSLHERSICWLIQASRNSNG